MEPSASALSPPERRALELYDILRELHLQLALQTARQGHVPDSSSPDGHATQTGLQARLLDAKAALALRDEVLESVLMMEPTLKAVHHATHASPVERDLLPYFQRRELANTDEARQYRALQEVTTALDDIELEARRACHRNGALAAELLRLTENSRSPVADVPLGERFAGEITALGQEVAQGRRRWKFMKGAASAIAAGSGVDWIRDERIRAIVLDAAEEDAVGTPRTY